MSGDQDEWEIESLIMAWEYYRNLARGFNRPWHCFHEDLEAAAKYAESQVVELTTKLEKLREAKASKKGKINERL